MSFPGGSARKNSPANAGDVDLILGSGRSPGARNSNSFQYSCLRNPTDRGAWQAIVYGVAEELATTKQLNNKQFFDYKEVKNIHNIISVEALQNIAK